MAIVTKHINPVIPIKNIQKWNSPEIIVPKTMIDNTYSAVFVNILTKRFFSLSLNFNLILFYDQLLSMSRINKEGEI